MKKWIFVAAIVTGVLMLGCGSNSGESKASPGKPDSTQTSGQPAGFRGKAREGGPGMRQQMQVRVPVEVTYVTLGDISNYLIYNSVLETEQTVDIFSRISGLVEKLFVEEGQRVQKNQPLVQLEQEEFALAEENARVQYDKAKSEFNRLKSLREKNLISQEEFDNASLSLRQAEIAWKQAQLNLDYTIVRAPISGIVAERLVRLGDRIQPSNRLFVISNLDDKVVKLYVPQEELPNCYVKQPAIIQSDVLPGITFKGWVKRISPIIDPQSGTFKVTVGISDPEGKLKPGMFINARLIVAQHQNTKLIPKVALIYEGEKAFFFILEGDTAQRVELKKSFEDNEKVELLNDVPVGTPVVVLGQSGLKDGVQVNIVETRRYSWQKQWPEPSNALTRQKSGKGEKPSGPRSASPN